MIKEARKIINKKTTLLDYHRSGKKWIFKRLGREIVIVKESDD